MYVGPCPESPLCQWFKAKKMNPSEVGKSINWSSAGSLVRVRRVMEQQIAFELFMFPTKRHLRNTTSSE